jgi:hypothetical protein
MKKVYLTMMFVINVPPGEDPNFVADTAREWGKNDAAGFLLALPTLEERLPVAVTAITFPFERRPSNSKLGVCNHPKLNDPGTVASGLLGRCAEEGCSNSYFYKA